MGPVKITDGRGFLVRHVDKTCVCRDITKVPVGRLGRMAGRQGVTFSIQENVAPLEKA